VVVPLIRAGSRGASRSPTPSPAGEDLPRQRRHRSRTAHARGAEEFGLAPPVPRRVRRCAAARLSRSPDRRRCVARPTDRAVLHLTAADLRDPEGVVRRVRRL